MEGSPEQTPKRSVTFENQPRKNQGGDEYVDPVASVEHFLASSEFEATHNIKVRFSEQGVSSVVAIIEADDDAFVLKMSHDRTQHPLIEVQFLNAWQQAGVSVPHVRATGMIGNQPYLLQDFISAPTLEDAYPEGVADMLVHNVYRDMGALLREMHTARSEGYGFLHITEEGIPVATHHDFASWLAESGLTKHMAYTAEKGLLDAGHGSLDEALDILREQNPPDTQSTYLHNDLTPDNVFSTSPLTVFDPNPSLGDPMVDVARTILRATSISKNPMTEEQFCEGYFSGDTRYNAQHVQAALLFSAYTSLPYLARHSGQEKRIAYIRDYLANTAHKLHA
jgi:fructosamine-3-kinase